MTFTSKKLTSNLSKIECELLKRKTIGITILSGVSAIARFQLYYVKLARAYPLCISLFDFIISHEKEWWFRYWEIYQLKLVILYSFNNVGNVALWTKHFEQGRRYLPYTGMYFKSKAKWAKLRGNATAIRPGVPLIKMNVFSKAERG